MNKGHILTIFVLLFVLISLGFQMNEILKTENNNCYEKACNKTTLDSFDNCIDIGRESTGFLSSEHYYLCDGNKVSEKCLEWDWVKTEKEYIFLGMKCELKENGGENE